MDHPASAEVASEAPYAGSGELAEEGMYADSYGLREDEAYGANDGMTAGAVDEAEGKWSGEVFDEGP